MSKSKDKGVTAVQAISAIEKMKTVEAINTYISEDETRKTVLDARNEKIIELSKPKEDPAIVVEPVDSEETNEPSGKPEIPAPSPNSPKNEEKEHNTEKGQDLGRIHGAYTGPEHDPLKK